MGSSECHISLTSVRVLFPCSRYKRIHDIQARSFFHAGRSFCLLLAYSSTCYKASKMPFLFHILPPLRFRSVPKGGSRREEELRASFHPRKYISSRTHCRYKPYFKNVLVSIDKALKLYRME